jgi:hypothetical protein
VDEDERSLRLLLDGREEGGLLFQTVESLVDREREHRVDQAFVMIVVREEADLQVEAGGTHEPIERCVARVLPAVLDACDLGLRRACSLGEGALAQVRTRTRLSENGPGRYPRDDSGYRIICPSRGAT